MNAGKPSWSLFTALRSPLETCATVGYVDMLGLSGSTFFWRLYRLLHDKSLLDEMDLELVEEYYLRCEKKSLITSKLVSCIFVATVVIAGGLYTRPLEFLLCSVLFIGLLEVTKRFCYYMVSSYVSISADFNSVFHRIIAAIRSREVVFFGMRKKFDMDTTLCLRSLRLELLRVLRSEVQCHLHMSRNLCKYSDFYYSVLPNTFVSWYDDCGKLLCEMFTFEMSQLALEDHVYDEFLQLSTLKLGSEASDFFPFIAHCFQRLYAQELWQLLFLLRSEYLRLFLLHLLHPSHQLILIFVNLVRETLLLRNNKARLSRTLEAVLFRDCCTKEKKIGKFLLFSSTAEKILAHLSFASEILSGNEVPNEQKFHCVAEILRRAIEICIPETHIEHEDAFHPDISSNSSVSVTDEVESIADELPVEKVYEGFPLVSVDEQKDIFLPSWQEGELNETVARSVVVELKSRLVDRMRKLDGTRTVKTDHAQQMAPVEEFQEILLLHENRDIEQVAGRDDLNIFSSISKKNVFQPHVKLDLKQAISSTKSMPSIDFIDDPENE